MAAGEDWFNSASASHEPHTRALAEARRRGMNVTLHAGEVTNGSNVEQAVFVHGAKRIGHGYRLVAHRIEKAEAIDGGGGGIGNDSGGGLRPVRNEPGVGGVGASEPVTYEEAEARLQRILAAGVHFEVCPTSSFETGGWQGRASEKGDWSRHRKLFSGCSRVVVVVVVVVCQSIEPTNHPTNQPTNQPTKWSLCLLIYLLIDLFPPPVGRTTLLS